MRVIAASFAAIVATAGLLMLALPPVGWWPLAWFALVPVFLASHRRGFLTGFLIGIGASLLLGWLAVDGLLYPVKSFTGEPTWTYLGAAMFGFVLSLACGFVGEMKSLSWRGILGIGAFAVLMDMLLLPVLPVSFAISQSRVTGMLSLASFTGIWGVSFALWSINVALAAGVVERKGRLLGIAGAAWAALMALAFVPTGGGTALTMRVAVVQSPSTELDQMTRLSRTGSPQLAVWPEFSGLAHTRGGNASTLINLARQPGMPMIVTSFPDGASPLPHNTAALFSSKGESRRYYKRRLFGGETRMHTPGTEAVAASTAWGPVGLNICFDSCFPSLMRETSQQGRVGLIALPTIDPESPHGFIAAMHAAFTPFRAAELGVGIARADGYAHSMLVANDGRVVADLPPGAETSVCRTLDITPRWTFYKAFGDWFLYVCGALLLLIGGLYAKDGALPLKRQERSSDDGSVEVLKKERPEIPEFVSH
jgi:apolipoprotein N-acyltransferase